ncbi:hypothetical protein QR685DRAFT_433231, partial [Neurospora intermedia]
YRFRTSIKLINEFKELDYTILYYLLTAWIGYNDFKKYYERFKYGNILLTYLYSE